MERRLAAIFASDVVGYSRLIRADEEGTLDRLKALRNKFIDPKVAEHNGRIVKLMGDGMLAEFANVVDAVRAAIEAQRSITEHNAGWPEERACWRRDRCVRTRARSRLGRPDQPAWPRHATGARHSPRAVDNKCLESRVQWP
jgi:class 3 adenylate cyclase